MISVLLVIIILIFPYFNISAQEDFASLRKNINYRAKLLSHHLNKTKDTLVLSCPQRMYRLYSVGSTKIKIDEPIDDFTYKLPLKKLTIGKYIMVTQLNGLKIVFELNILKRASFKQENVSDIVASGLTDKDYKLDIKHIDVKLKNENIRIKPYNITDLDRRGMQSRDDCRRIMALNRAKLRAEIKKRRLFAIH